MDIDGWLIGLVRLKTLDASTWTAQNGSLLKKKKRLWLWILPGPTIHSHSGPDGAIRQMQSYRFDGLVQGRLLHLQLALLKLVKVIPTLRRTQTKHFGNRQSGQPMYKCKKNLYGKLGKPTKPQHQNLPAIFRSIKWLLPPVFFVFFLFPYWG